MVHKRVLFVNRKKVSRGNFSVKKGIQNGKGLDLEMELLHINLCQEPPSGT